MSTEVVKCCYNCKHFHFYSGVCDKNNNMPSVDLKLPCKNFEEGGFKIEPEISRRCNETRCNR